MTRAHRIQIGACLLGVAALVTAATYVTRRELSASVDRSRSAYVGSDACRSCHPQHHASWHRTFHRTMTQEATRQSVRGDFDRGELDYGGIHASMRWDGDTPTITFSRHAGAERWQATVVRSVGSHRMQQYLMRDHDTFLRLPVAWDLERGRWMHMNGAFLTPDPTSIASNPTRAEIARHDYDRHVTRWNDNCVFCHNVAPNPGLDDSERFDTSVAELGIACEACHGPGDDHARANRNPLRRYVLHLTDDQDPTVANPSRMTSTRSNEVCGRCHGQRKATDMARVLRAGDTFIPGTPLTAHSTPLARDTTLNGAHGVFAARFWNDGTPRLTAYEYQGLLQSPCAVDPRFTCGSCHAMHDSDPDGQLRSDLNHADAQCTQCHAELASPARIAAHTRHGANGAGSRCHACHMPKVVYGLVGARISHRIESPSPAAQADAARPDACTLCHVDRTRAWAATAMQRWTEAIASQSEAHANAPSEVARMLFAGDPIERALAAAALGRHDIGDAVDARRAWLLDALAVDRYPAVRHIARRSLRALDTAGSLTDRALADYDATELSATQRAQTARTLALALGSPSPAPLTPNTIEALRSAAPQQDIEIGE